MYKQLTPDEYDIAIMEAERDLTISGIEEDEETVSNREFITRADFFKDLKKCCKPIAKVSPKPSKT